MTKNDNLPTGTAIRETAAQDLQEVLALYPQAFPDEELRPVVSELLTGSYEVFSLGAFLEGDVVAHVLFTLCGTQKGARGDAVLAPLGVVPTYQGRGIGNAIVHAGVAHLAQVGINQLFVLGDPGYYSRFGFKAERAVLPPYDLPVEWADAWQSLLLSPEATPGAGRLQMPEPWMHRELWVE